MKRRRAVARRAPPPDEGFAARLVRWQRRSGRHDLPWQGTREPYRIWVSEIMLQQTQVTTVIPYYGRFLARFPDLASLARADSGDVLRLWAGLGYYSRARNLHRAARELVSACGGRFPKDRKQLQALPGAGRSTAAAVAVFAFGAREAILDGNVKRVLARHFAIRGFPGDRSVESRLWRLADSLLPIRAVDRYTQALMDLGSAICTRAAPSCEDCPLRSSCKARAMNRVQDFPARRPREPLPLRATTMLVLMRAGKVLLEKRPPAGIWGGLWSLPEMPVAERDERRALKAHCAARLDCVIGAVSDPESLRHGFTHFTLDIRVLRCEVSAMTPRVREGERVWIDIDEAQGAAIPAPVKKILLRVRSESPSRSSKR